MTTEEEPPTSPLNTRLPERLNTSVRKAAIDIGLKLQGFSATAYRFFLYIIENYDLKNTGKMAKATYPLICLRTARNDLEKQGYNTEALDLEIKKAEMFLQC